MSSSCRALSPTVLPFSMQGSYPTALPVGNPIDQRKAPVCLFRASWRYDEHRVRQRLRDSFSPQHTSIIVIGRELAGCVTVRPAEGRLWLEHFYLAPHHQGLMRPPEIPFPSRPPVRNDEPHGVH